MNENSGRDHSHRSSAHPNPRLGFRILGFTKSARNQSEPSLNIINLHSAAFSLALCEIQSVERWFGEFFWRYRDGGALSWLNASKSESGLEATRAPVVCLPTCSRGPGPLEARVVGEPCKENHPCETPWSAIPIEWRVEYFADDLNTRQGIVSGTVALLPRSTEIQPLSLWFVPPLHLQNQNALSKCLCNLLKKCKFFVIEADTNWSHGMDYHVAM